MSTLERHATWWIALEAIALAWLIQLAPVSYVDFDARPTLLVSEALVEHHGFALEDMPGLDALPPNTLEHVGEHTYYAFPVGTPLLSVPFVALERAASGHAPLDPERVQKRIAGLLVGVLLVLTFALARVFLRPLDAALMATFAVLGSSLTSTLGTALWSHDFASVITTLVLLLVARMHRGDARAGAGVLVGVLLWLAYLCRPTLAIMAPCVLWWMAGASRRAALEAAATALVGLALTLAFFLTTRGVLLPPYYLPSRLVGTEHDTLHVLHGLTFSPSRGLFVFSPLLLLPLLALPRSLRASSPDAPMARALSLWCLLHLVTMLRFPHWWGGVSYGPRLMTDIVPPLAALLFSARAAWVGPRWRLVRMLVVALGVFSIAVHTGQGLFQTATLDWNGFPSVDAHPEQIFDWRYPQFLHTDARARSRARQGALEQLARADLPSACGETWSFAATNVFWIGWYDVEPNGRWSADREGDIYFRCARGDLQGRLDVRGRTEGPQRLRVRLNGVVLLSTSAAGHPEDFRATFDPRTLDPSGWNRLRFETPDARHALGSTDRRMLGFAIERVRLE